MGAKGGTDPAASSESALTQNSSALIQLAQQQQNQSSQLFNASFPGFGRAENFYSALSSGDPFSIARATAPVAAQADQSADAAKKNILQNGPAGGEKNLALEQVDVNRGATVGDAASKGYLNSFNALSSLAGQGIGESQNATGAAISGLSGSNSALSSIGNFQLQAQQLQTEQKGNSLGALSSLGGDAATLGAAGIGAEGGKAAGAGATALAGALPFAFI